MSERTALTKASETKGKSPSTKPRDNLYQSMDSPVEQILQMQQTIGNQEVQRLIKSGTIQAKLTIGKPNDKYEQEADRVADQVMSMTGPGVQRQPEEEKEEIQTKPLAEQITPLVQRQVGPGEEEEPLQTKLLQSQETEEEEEPVQTKLQRKAEEEEEPIQTKPANNQTPSVTSNIESSINSLKGRGQPLSESTRSYFESRFGTDFSQVKVHTDSKAGEVSKSVNAKAFTTGKDVVFGAGQYSPETSTGKQLLAHELTHVIQQGGIRRKEIGSVKFDSQIIAPSKTSDDKKIEKSDEGKGIQTEKTESKEQQEEFKKVKGNKEETKGEGKNKTEVPKPVEEKLQKKSKTKTKKEKGETKTSKLTKKTKKTPNKKQKDQVKSTSQKVEEFKESGQESVQIPGTSPVMDVESKGGTQEPVDMNALLNYKPDVASKELKGMVNLVLKESSSSIETIERTVVEVKKSSKVQAEDKKNSIEDLFDDKLDDIEDEFEKSRDKLEDFMDDAKEGVEEILENKQKKAREIGDTYKKNIKDFYKNKRKKIEEVIEKNKKKAENLDEKYVESADKQIQHQADAVRAKGKTKADSIVDNDDKEREKDQKEAVIEVADDIAEKIEDTKLDIFKALRKMAYDIPDEIEEQGEDFLDDADDRISDILDEVDDVVEAFEDSLEDEVAPLIYDNINKIYEELSNQIDRVEEDTIKKVMEIKQQSIQLVDKTLKESLENIEKSKEEAIKQIGIFGVTVVENLLSSDLPDIPQSRSYTAGALNILREATGGYIKSYKETETGIIGDFGTIETKCKGFLGNTIYKEIKDCLKYMQHMAHENVNQEVIKISGTIFDELLKEEPKVLTEIVTNIKEAFNDSESKLQAEYDKVFAKVDSEVEKAMNDTINKYKEEIIGNLDEKLQEAAEEAAWAYDHGFLAFLKSVGKGIWYGIRLFAGLIVGIIWFLVKTIGFIIGLILAIIGLILLVVYGGLAGLVTAVIIIITAVGALIYGIVGSIRDRMKGGEGFFSALGNTILDLIGINEIINSFTDPYLTPFEGGMMFGEGLTNLVITIFTLRGFFRALGKGARRMFTKTVWINAFKGVGPFFKTFGSKIYNFFNNIKNLKKINIKSANDKVRKFADDAIQDLNKKLKDLIDKGVQKKGTGKLSSADCGAKYKQIISKLKGKGRVIGEYSAIKPGVLTDDVAGTFSGGRYAVIKLDKPIELHRAWSASQKEFASYWSLEKPAGSLQTRINSGLLPEWGQIKGTPFRTQATNYTTIRVPSGRKIYVGEAGYQKSPWIGGNSQILIEGGPKTAWKIDEGVLK